jgi:hypothetical protein
MSQRTLHNMRHNVRNPPWFTFLQIVNVTVPRTPEEHR